MESDGRLELTRQLIREIIKKAKTPHSFNANGVLFKKHHATHYLELAKEAGVETTMASLPDSFTLREAIREEAAKAAARKVLAAHRPENQSPSLRARQPGTGDQAEISPAEFGEQVRRQLQLNSSEIVQSNAVFRRGAHGWDIRLCGESCVAPDRIGFCYIDVLLRHPGRGLRNSQVMALVGGIRNQSNSIDRAELGQHFGVDSDDEEDTSPNEVSPGFQTEEVVNTELEMELLLDTKREIASKKRGQTAARARADLELANKMGEEIRQIESFLSKNLRLFGRPRKLRGDADRAREAVSHAIGRAIEIVARLNATIGSHFTNNIEVRTGDSIYLDTDIEWVLGPWSTASRDCHFLPVNVDLLLDGFQNRITKFS